MKQPTASQTTPQRPQYTQSDSTVDTATLDLFASWKAEDATTDPEKLREADEEVAAFKKAMNEDRAATRAQPFPSSSVPELGARSFLNQRNRC